MTTRLTVEIVDHVATVTLNRPQKNNAIDMEMFEAFIETGRRLRNETRLRAVVLTGAGDHFCAGIDLSVFQDGSMDIAGGGRMVARTDSPANFFQSAAYVWRELQVPVIVAIKGVAFGGGLQIALGGDIRYAAPEAQLSVMEVKWGIIPDMAISTTAHHVVAVDKLKELAYTGRVISGVEAEALGLVTALKDDPLTAALEIAQQIAARSPDAIRSIKKMLDESWQQDSASRLRQEAELQSAILGSPNQVEAVMANLQKRAAEFRDG